MRTRLRLRKLTRPLFSTGSPVLARNPPSEVPSGMVFAVTDGGLRGGAGAVVFDHPLRGAQIYSTRIVVT